MTEHVSEPQGSPCPGSVRRAPPAEDRLITPSAALVPAKAERLVSVHATIAVLDTARYEQMWKVATAIANSSFCPETLAYTGEKNNRTLLPDHKIIANCFLIVNQAVRWEMDPFALIQCASMVKGKPCYEGKVIAAVLDSLLSIKLDCEYTGEGALMQVTISGTRSDGKTKTVKGSVAKWKTSMWQQGEEEKMLSYRGTREWARLYEPAVLLGVHSDDEAVAFREDDLIDVTPGPAPPAALPPRRRPADARQGALTDHYNQDLEQVAAAGDILEKALKKDPVATAAAVDQALDAAKMAPLKPPPAMPPRRTAVRSPKSIKEKKDDPFDAIEDEDIRGWCKLFRVDLKDCQGAPAVHDLLDRRQKAIDGLPVPAGKLVTALVNEVLSELQ